MIDLCETSRLCHEAGIHHPHEFEEVFHRSPRLEITHPDEIMNVLEVCNYFHVGMSHVLHLVYPWKTYFKKISQSDTPLAHDVYTALIGSPVDILSTFDLEMIEWVHHHRFPFCKNHYEKLFDRMKDRLASTKDKILLVWQRLFDLGVPPHEDIIHEACNHRHARRLVEWLWQHGCSLESFDIVRVMKSDSTFDPSFISKMIREGKCPLSSYTVASMAAAHHLQFVRWWHSQGYPICTSAIAWAAVWGDVSMVRLLVELKAPIDQRWTMGNAYTSGNQALVHYLRTHFAS